MTPERETELLAQIEKLTDRVIAAETGRHDEADLDRENANLRALLAEAPTSEAAIAKLREWSASSNPAYEYGPGAIQIAMSVAMARKILDEIDRLVARVTDYENRITWGATCQQCATVLDRAIADYERAERAEAERDRARGMLRYCFKRWPAPIFWHAAAQIDEPYTALPDWLTGEPVAETQRETDADAMRAQLLDTQVERLSAKWLGNEPAAAAGDETSEP